MKKQLSEDHKRKIAEKMRGNNNAKKDVAIVPAKKKAKPSATVLTINLQKELQKFDDPFSEANVDIIEPKYSMQAFGNYFEHNEYHSSACKFKADAVVGQGWEIQPNNNINIPQDSQYKRLRNFIENSHPYESFEQQIRKAWLDYEAFGNLYLEIDVTRTGQLVALGHIPAKTIRKAGHKKNGYWHVANYREKEKYFDAYGKVDSLKYNYRNTNQLIHLKNYYYDSSFYGYPDILPALAVMYLDQKLVNYNTRFFENNAIPEGIIIYKNSEKPDDETMERILEYQTANFKGDENQRRLLILATEGEEADIEFINLSQEKDLSFEKLHKMCRDRVLTAHRLPPKIAGTITAGELGQSNQSYAEMQLFQELIVKPRQQQLEFMLNRLFRDHLGITNWQIKFKNFDYTPDETDAQYVSELVKNNIMTRDEARAYLNLPVSNQLPQVSGSIIAPPTGSI